jgi:tRNA G37 N-methylase TrmD
MMHPSWRSSGAFLSTNEDVLGATWVIFKQLRQYVKDNQNASHAPDREYLDGQHQAKIDKWKTKIAQTKTEGTPREDLRGHKKPQEV